MALGPALRCRPRGQLGNTPWPLSFVQVNPRAFKVIKVAAEAETATGPLECLRFRARPGVVIVRPFFSGGGMRAQAEDRQLTGDQHLGHNLLIFAAFEIRARMDAVSAGPAGWSEQRVQTIGVRLMKTRGWERHVRDCSKRIEIHLGPAVAVVLFNDYGHFQPAKCYLKPKGVERLTPFLPLLEEVAEKGTFLLVAISLLNLIETAPSAAHLPLIIGAGLSWATTISDDKEFWVDHGIGRRLCALIEAILTLDSKLFRSQQALRRDADNLLAALVRMGVAEAYQLEDKLRLLQ